MMGQAPFPTYLPPLPLGGGDLDMFPGWSGGFPGRLPPACQGLYDLSRPSLSLSFCPLPTCPGPFPLPLPIVRAHEREAGLGGCPYPRQGLGTWTCLPGQRRLVLPSHF